MPLNIRHAPNFGPVWRIFILPRLTLPYSGHLKCKRHSQCLVCPFWATVEISWCNVTEEDQAPSVEFSKVTKAQWFLVSGEDTPMELNVWIIYPISANGSQYILQIGPLKGVFRDSTHTEHFLLAPFLQYSSEWTYDKPPWTQHTQFAFQNTRHLIWGPKLRQIHQMVTNWQAAMVEI